MNVTIKNIKNCLPDNVEKEILKHINKKSPFCYAKLLEEEIILLNKNIIENPYFKKYDINIEQIKSIRSSYVKNKMIMNHPKLIKNTNNIIKDYKNKISILNISKKYDGSPLNILRIILSKTNSKEKIKKFFNNPEFLNNYDFEQFNIAKKNDDFALVNQDETLKRATEFEKDIEQILINKNIEYETQEDLSREQIKTHGKAYCTPDFLIKTDFQINNRTVKWIDAKNFYGSNIHFIKSKIEEQTKKYLKNYGDGCIIFKLGFNEVYNENKNILFLSWNSFLEI